MRYNRLGSTGLIIVPAFNGKTKLPNHEARPLLIDLLKELGEHAVSVKSRILLEPLNRKEAFFLRQVADAASICRDAGSPGICCMGDFWHMTWEETSDCGAFLSGGSALHHVHIASRKTRNMPGEDEGDKISHIQTREQLFVVEAYAEITDPETLEDKLDLMSSEIETAVFADQFLGGKCHGINLVGTDSDLSGEGKSVLGVVMMIFKVIYLTGEGSPDTTL